MRPSKGEMLQRLENLEYAANKDDERLREQRRELNKLESIVKELAKRQGYYLVHKNGYYLEPIKEEPYGN